jgi:hypothetical protein
VFGSKDLGELGSELRTEGNSIKRRIRLWVEDENVNIAKGILSWCFNWGSDKSVMLSKQGVCCCEDLVVNIPGHARCGKGPREMGERLAAHCEGLRVDELAIEQMEGTQATNMKRDFYSSLLKKLCEAPNSSVPNTMGKRTSRRPSGGICIDKNECAITAGAK